MPLSQTVHGGADHVVGVLRTDRLGTTSLNAEHFEHGTHRTTGDDTGTLRRGAHDNLAGAVTAFHVVVQGAAFAQRHADHLALGLLGGFADRLGHLFGFALAEADAAFLIANDHQCREAEALTTLYGLGHAVDRDQTIGEFRGFVAVAAVAPAVVILPLASFLGRMRPILNPVADRPRIIEAGRTPACTVLDLQTAFTRGIGQSLDLAMEEEAATVEVGLFDAGFLRALGDAAPTLAAASTLFLPTTPRSFSRWRPKPASRR